MKTDQNNDENPYKDPGLLASFAVPGQMIASILGGGALGLIIGILIDHALGSSPIATLIGLLLGLAAGTYVLLRFVSRLK